MIAICIEASHARGLGHLYRSLNLALLLQERGERFVFLVNGDPRAAKILAAHGVDHRTVPLHDADSGWESGVIREYGVTLWLNDRMDTPLCHARRVKGHGIGLVTVDDRGPGAGLADLHFAPLIFDRHAPLAGQKVLTGPDYLILNREIERYRRRRERPGSLVVSLGGSDTHGITLHVAAILKRLGLPATIVTGPSFAHAQELVRLAEGRFTIKSAVPSLVEEFARHDLAVTAGGITPFEANAAGLPCLVIAAEPHETEIARHLESVGSSRYAGFRGEIDEALFATPLDLAAMSSAGWERITTRGGENIYREIAAWLRP